MDNAEIIAKMISIIENSNPKKDNSPNKRTFGKFSGRATAVFSDDWAMTEEELCD